MTIDFVDDNQENFSVTIDPTFYLLSSADDTTCHCQISQSIEGQEAFILGTPFFRTKIVSMEFQNSTVSLWNKDVTSPIIPVDDGGIAPSPTPTPSDGGDSDKMGGGAIFGIVFAVLVVLAALFGGCYYYT